MSTITSVTGGAVGGVQVGAGGPTGAAGWCGLTYQPTYTTDVVEFTAPGSTALRWDGTQFVHNWRIPTGKGLCYRVTSRAAASSGLAPATADHDLVARFRTR